MKEQREKNGRSETPKREVTVMIETQGGNIVIAAAEVGDQSIEGHWARRVAETSVDWKGDKAIETQIDPQDTVAILSHSSSKTVRLGCYEMRWMSSRLGWVAALKYIT
ncbi:Hypothetical predicted protein [Olea europaea subsp. europaea]|uniref:Uncharacterized protein n=1 Tax=Olea europaea subsp. europaea TaxID=158383 RepID=A0A8S0UA78_OLEEU|nr:Hypothetical predicted protein [Olea europaea subsp. europaea]